MMLQLWLKVIKLLTEQCQIKSNERIEFMFFLSYIHSNARCYKIHSPQETKSYSTLTAVDLTVDWEGKKKGKKKGGGGLHFSIRSTVCVCNSSFNVSMTYSFLSHTWYIHFVTKHIFFWTEKNRQNKFTKPRMFHLCSSTNIQFLTEHTDIRNDVILTDASDSAVINSVINNDDEAVWLVCGMSLTCIRNDNIAWRFLKKVWNQENTTTLCKTGTIKMTASSKHT